MTTRILAFGASTSKQSINKKLAQYAANQLNDAAVEVLDLNDVEMPIFSIDKEKENGIPEQAHNFKRHVEQSDGIIISFAEHNGSFAAAYKNIYDWVSRIDANVWMNKPLFLLATSPGGRGGKSVLAHASALYGFRNPHDIPTFSLPLFYDNFKHDNIADKDLKNEFDLALEGFRKSLASSSTEPKP